MAKINFDIAKKLDITCRRGDSFSLELTLKDSSGIPINLYEGTDGLNFHLHAQTHSGTPVFLTQGSGFSTGGAFNGEFITPNVTDTSSTTTADPSDASYIASTAASGVVKFEVKASEMKLGSFPAGTMNLLYDIQYEDLVVANQVDGENNTRTILYGNLVIKDDLSIRT